MPEVSAKITWTYRNNYHNTYFIFLTGLLAERKKNLNMSLPTQRKLEIVQTFKGP